jgi:hypothetical protein
MLGVLERMLANGSRWRKCCSTSTLFGAQSPDAQFAGCVSADTARTASQEPGKQHPARQLRFLERQRRRFCGTLPAWTT